MLLPNTKFLEYWLALIAPIIIYNVFFVPIDVMVLEEEGCDWRCNMEYFFDFLFFMDIIINFRTAYFNEDSAPRPPTPVTPQTPSPIDVLTRVDGVRVQTSWYSTTGRSSSASTMACFGPISSRRCLLRSLPDRAQVWHAARTRRAAHASQ